MTSHISPVIGPLWQYVDKIHAGVPVLSEGADGSSWLAQHMRAGWPPLCRSPMPTAPTKRAAHSSICTSTKVDLPQLYSGNQQPYYRLMQ